jgi:cyclopropane-fatty-acyl-phospholipid synthase
VRDASTTSAAFVLRHIFASLEMPFAFRLWDGSTVQVGGPGESPCAIVLRSRAVARRLLRRPTPLRFGEAFINGEIDIEGDVFAAMRVAGQLDRNAVGLRQRLGLLPHLLRI